LRCPIPVYASPATQSEILRMFPYMQDSRHSRGQGRPSFEWNVFSEDSSFVIPSCGDIEVIPLPVEHGKDHSIPIRKPYTCMGFRIGDFSYLGDVSFVPEATRRKVQGTRTLVLNALREQTQSSHFSIGEVWESVRRPNH